MTSLQVARNWAFINDSMEKLSTASEILALMTNKREKDTSVKLL